MTPYKAIDSARNEKWDENNQRVRSYTIFRF